MHARTPPRVRSHARRRRTRRRALTRGLPLAALRARPCSFTQRDTRRANNSTAAAAPSDTCRLTTHTPTRRSCLRAPHTHRSPLQHANTVQPTTHHLSHARTPCSAPARPHAGCSRRIREAGAARGTAAGRCLFGCHRVQITTVVINAGQLRVLALLRVAKQLVLPGVAA